jgi:hypothetical protein
MESLVLRHARLAEQVLQREVALKCDWDDADDVLLYRRYKNQKARIARIEELVPDLKCPICKHVRTGPRQWIVNRRQTLIVCRSCFQRCHPKENVAIHDLMFVPFVEPEPRFILHSAVLKQARLNLGISMKEFAMSAGWTGAYQSQLESEHPHNIPSVSFKTAQAIMMTFAEYGVDVSRAGIPLA